MAMDRLTLILALSLLTFALVAYDIGSSLLGRFDVIRPCRIESVPSTYQCDSLGSYLRPSADDIVQEVVNKVFEKLKPVHPAADPVCSPAAAAAADDRAVLLSLLETWGGLKASKARTWRYDREISTWGGVTIDHDGRVTGLRLKASGLDGERLVFLDS